MSKKRRGPEIHIFTRYLDIHTLSLLPIAILYSYISHFYLDSAIQALPLCRHSDLCRPHSPTVLWILEIWVFLLFTVSRIRKKKRKAEEKERKAKERQLCTRLNVRFLGGLMEKYKKKHKEFCADNVFGVVSVLDNAKGALGLVGQGERIRWKSGKAEHRFGFWIRILDEWLAVWRYNRNITWIGRVCLKNSERLSIDSNSGLYFFSERRKAKKNKEKRAFFLPHI